MSRTTLLSFAASLALVVSPLATAQGPPGGMRGPGGPGGPGGFGGPGGPMGPPLLMFPAVQKELKLTESQKSQYRKLQTTVGQKMRTAFSRPRQGRSDPEKMRTQMEAINKEQEKGIARILKEEQAKRLGEIELQREGIFAVARSPIAKKLKLTSDQSKQIKTIVDEMHEAQFAAMPRPPQGFQGPGGGRAAGGFQGGPPGQGNVQGGPPGENGFQQGGAPGQGNFQGGPPGENGSQQGGPPGGWRR
jgi:Spy/CpxP family protein refolding chaperone